MQIAEFNGVIPGRILDIISKKGLKQCSVAEKAGMKPNELYAILANRRIIKSCEIKPLADALEVEVNELFKTEWGEGNVVWNRN